MLGANRQSGNSARAPRRADARLAADTWWALGTPHYRSASARHANQTRTRLAGSAEQRVQSGKVPVDDPGHALHGPDAVALALAVGCGSGQHRDLLVDVGAGEHAEAVHVPVIGHRMR